MEGSSTAAGVCGCTFEDGFQIMIVILIEPTKLLWFLRTLQLSGHVAVLRTVVRLNRQTAVGPQLPLGAAAVRCLTPRDQRSCPHRTTRSSLAQHFSGAVFSALQ